jgi:hypothetical protein
LVVAGIAMRRVRAKVARAARARAQRAARQAGIPALMAEVESASLVLNKPAARLIAGGEEQLLLLEEVEAVLESGTLVVDACRHIVRGALGAAMQQIGQGLAAKFCVHVAILPDF